MRADLLHFEFHHCNYSYLHSPLHSPCVDFLTNVKGCTTMLY